MGKRQLESRGTASARRLKIGVDIDGVLADIVEQMLPLLARECGRPVAQGDIICYSFTDALGIPEGRIAAIIEEVITGGHFELAPVVPGAVEALRALSAHEIWIVTSRPEVVRDQTICWLARHGLPYDELVFAPPHDKAREGDGFHLFVEDNLETALLLAEEGIDVLLFDRPWNRVPPLPAKVQRVSDWAEILCLVEQQLSGTAPKPCNSTHRVP